MKGVSPSPTFLAAAEMASPNTPRRGQLRGYSEYSLRTSVKMGKNKIDLEQQLTRLEEETTRKMAAHRAKLRKLEVDMARRHSGASPTRQRKSPTEETGSNEMLSASMPDFGRKRASSFSNLAARSEAALIVPTSPASNRAFNRSRSHSGSDLRSRTPLPEIRISSNDVDPQKKDDQEASEERRHTVPVVQVSPVGGGSDRRRYTAPSIQVSPPKKTSISQKSSPKLSRNIVQPSPPQTPSPTESPKSLSPDTAQRLRSFQRMTSTPAAGSLHHSHGSRTPPSISPARSLSTNRLSSSYDQNRLTRSFSDLRTANLSRPKTAKEQITLEEQFELLKDCRYLRQPIRHSDNSVSKSQEYLTMSQ